MAALCELLCELLAIFVEGVVSIIGAAPARLAVAGLLLLLALAFAGGHVDRDRCNAFCRLAASGTAPALEALGDEVRAARGRIAAESAPGSSACVAVSRSLTRFATCPSRRRPCC